MTNQGWDFHSESFLCDCGADHANMRACLEISRIEGLPRPILEFCLTEFTSETPWWERVKIAWRVLLGKKVCFCLVIAHQDLGRLKALINRIPDGNEEIYRNNRGEI